MGLWSSIIITTILILIAWELRDIIVNPIIICTRGGVVGAGLPSPYEGVMWGPTAKCKDIFGFYYKRLLGRVLEHLGEENDEK